MNENEERVHKALNWGTAKEEIEHLPDVLERVFISKYLPRLNRDLVTMKERSTNC